MVQDTNETRKNIIVLGGSYGGVSIAHYVLKHTIPQLPDKGSYQVIIISTATQAICRPACPRAMISDDMFPQHKLFVSISKQFEQYSESSFRLIHGSATQVDHENRIVSVTSNTGKTETLAFHALVIATGASTPSPLLSLNRDEKFLRDAWAEIRKALPHVKSIVIAGGGPAGIETAAELGEHLNGRPGWLASKPTSPKASITVVNASSDILPALRPSIARTAELYLAKIGVTVINNTRVKSVTPENVGNNIDSLTIKATVTFSDDKTLKADLYIPATGMIPNTNFLAKELLTSDSRVDTNVSTLRVDKAGPRIYAVGDASSYARPAVHNILAAIPVLGTNVKRDLLLAAGKSETEVPRERKFEEDKRETQMVPIGMSKGVGAAMGWSLPSWMVWAIKGRDYWLWTTGGLWSGKQWSKES